MRPEDLTGKKFNRLSVIALYGRTRRKVAKWLCRCDCGKSVVVQHSNLKTGHTKSCGCLNLEQITKHGMQKTPLYKVWHGIKSRCVNPNHKAWGYYGGRGIQICSKWMMFEGFYEDMGERPTIMHTIERKDNNGNYTKENCVWALQADQLRNTRRNIFVEYKGQKKCVKDWSIELGQPYQMLLKRIRNGWNTERAFSKCSQRSMPV